MSKVTKFCPRCSKEYPLTENYFYPARKINRKKIGWQSYCKSCWKDINLANKQRRRETRKDNIRAQYFGTMIPT